MKLHELSPAPGSNKPVKRIGRGPASGQGKTAGKGHKGQKARAGRGIFRLADANRSHLCDQNLLHRAVGGIRRTSRKRQWQKHEKGKQL